MTNVRTDFANELLKLDKAAVGGLTGTANSIGYKLEEIERHFHNTGLKFGLTGTNMTETGLSPIVVLGGQQVWGTELMIYDGTTIEAGSSIKKFDFHQTHLVTVSVANRPTYIQFFSGSTGSDVAATLTDAGDLVGKVSHGLTDGTKIMFNTIVTTTGINTYTTYYVVNKSDNSFQVSLTLAGAAAAVVLSGGNGTANYTVLTQTVLTTTMMCAANTTSDAMPNMLMCRRITCNNKMWVRAMTTTANTCSVEFFIGLHVYDA